MWIRVVKPLWHLETLRQSSKSPWLFSLYSLYSDTPHKKSKLAPLQERKMIDRFRLYAKGGDGGSGCSSFRRSRHERRGRPDGGNGGKGGDVILECSPTIWDFSGLQHHVAANRGGHGGSKNMIGTRGDDKAWAQLEIQQESNRSARQLFEKAVQASPRNRFAWHVWGVSEANMGNIDKGEKLLKIGHALNPREPVLLQSLALLEYKHSSANIA